MRRVHPTLAGVSSWSPKKETSAGHAVVPEEREPRIAPRSPPRRIHTSALALGRCVSSVLRPGTTWDLVGQVFPSFSPGETTKHPHVSAVDNRLFHGQRLRPPTPALQTREDPGAHERPKRDSSRSITAWPLRRRPCGTTLAAYPSRRRVRAVTSARRRTRTGRM